jgi:predicted regulator of Ras-like GTPase activity (Roadblock/LC7/MglB family)
MKGFREINVDRIELDNLLRPLVVDAGCSCAILITQDGQHVSSVGDTSFINLTALAALVAGMFSATKEVARLLGEVEFSILFQQGTKRNIQISLVFPQMMLIVVFEGIEKTGMVRLQCHTQAQAIGKLFSTSPSKPVETPALQPQDSTKTVDSVSPETTPVVKPVSYPSAAVGKPPSAAPAPASASAPQAETQSIGSDSFKEFASSLLDEIFGRIDSKG